MFATVDRVGVDYVARMLFEVLFEGAEFEFNRSVGEIEQTIWHINVIERARQSYNGGIVAEIDDDIFRMRRRRSASLEGARHDCFACVGPIRVGVRVVGMVARMVRSDAERTTVDEAELVVGQVDVLEALANESVAIDLVNVAVAQIERHNVVVRVAVWSENF